jgi:hypothetical protein
VARRTDPAPTVTPWPDDVVAAARQSISDALDAELGRLS